MVHAGFVAQHPLEILTPEQVQLIHEASLSILERTGVHLEDSEMAARARAEGAEIDAAHERARFPAERMEEFSRTLACEITLHARDPKRSVTLRPGEVYAHNLGTDSNTCDLETRERRSSVLSDLEASTRLADALENLHLVNALLAPTDLPPRAHPGAIMRALVRNTTKPVSAAGWKPEDIRVAVQIWEAILGDPAKLRRAPHVDAYASPVSPLDFNRDVTGCMKVAAEFGLPFSVLPCPMTGTSAPQTFAGGLAQQNAEILAGAFLMRLYNPRVPIEYGARLSLADMRTGLSLWGPVELGMVSAAATQLARRYGAPISVYGVCSDSHADDMQAGYEAAFNVAVPMLAGANMLSGAGGAGGNYSTLERMVVHDEIFGMAFRILRGFAVDVEHLALDVIDRVGPRGMFLSQRHTLAHIADADRYPYKLAERGNYEDWVKRGKKRVEARAFERAKELLSKHEVPPLDPDIQREVDRIVEASAKGQLV